MEGEWLGGFTQKNVGYCNAYMAELWEMCEGWKR